MCFHDSWIYEFFFAPFSYKGEVFYGDHRCLYNRFITEKKTLCSPLKNETYNFVKKNCRFRIRENMWRKLITRQMAQSTSTAPFKSPNNYENRDEFKTPKQTTSPFNQPPAMMKSRSQRRLLVEGNFFSCTYQRFHFSR